MFKNGPTTQETWAVTSRVEDISYKSNKSNLLRLPLKTKGVTAFTFKIQHFG